MNWGIIARSRIAEEKTKGCGASKHWVKKKIKKKGDRPEM